MEERATRRRFELKWGLIAVGWMLYGFFFASQIIFTRAYLGRPPRVGGTLAAWLICSFAFWPPGVILARKPLLFNGSVFGVGYKSFTCVPVIVLARQAVFVVIFDLLKRERDLLHEILASAHLHR